MSDALTTEEWSILVLSLRVSAVSLLVCLGPGILIGWLLARRRFPGRLLVEAVVHLPLVLPPVAVGYLLLVLFGRNGPLGGVLDRMNLEVAFTWKAAALASAVMAFPLMVRSVRLAIQMVDPGLEAAATTLGASPLRTFFTVTLPLATHGVLSGSILCFIRSVGEFGATITVAGNIAGRTRTLPLAIYTASQTPHGDIQAMRLIVLSILVSLGSLILSEWLTRKASPLGATG